MKNILEKMIYAAASCAMLIAVVLTSSSSGVAQNHNPEFSVSNLNFDGSNYILIGEDDSQDYGLRTEVELKYRDGVPDKGTTTLEWTSGSNKVFAYEGANSMTGFKDEDQAADKADTDGPWTWDDADQSNFDGAYIYFQGKADHVDNGNEVSYADDTVTLQASHSDSSESFEKDFELVKLDIDAVKVSGGAPQQGQRLEESEEESSGAFLPVNNDDDDYDLTADNSQSGGSGRSANGRDTDLLPVQLVGIGFGDYTLDIPSHLRVWESDDRTQQVTTSSISANSDTVLYVEGESQGSGQLKIDWSDSSNNLSKTNADRITIKAFEWEGPLNVPGYSIYEYSVSSAPSSATGWTSVSGGSIESGANSSTAHVLWDSGPEVGEITYTVNQSYSWNLEVNVVEVAIGNNSITRPQSANVDQVFSNNGSPTFDDSYEPTRNIHSSGDFNLEAMEAEMLITSIEGPTVDNQIRGMQFIELGFVQHVDITNITAYFDDLTNPKKKVKIYEDSQNAQLTTDILDIDDNGVSVVKPWYRNDSNCYLTGISDSQALTDENFSMSDTPGQEVSDSWTISDYYGGEMEVDEVDSADLELNFDLYFAVRTTDERNDADEVFTQRAKVSWQFVGSGDFNNRNWSGTNAGVDVSPGSFDEVTNGDVVPNTTGDIANSLNVSYQDQYQ